MSVGALWGDGKHQCKGPQDSVQYPVHPYVLFSVGQGTANATAVQGYRSFLQRTTTAVPRSAGGYIETPIRAALLGMAETARWAVHDRANGSRTPQVYRFPGLYAGNEGANSGPSGEVMGFANQVSECMADAPLMGFCSSLIVHDVGMRHTILYLRSMTILS